MSEQHQVPYHHIARQFYNRPLCLLPAAAETISAFLLSRIAAGRGAKSDSDSGSSTQLFQMTQTAEGGIEYHAARASRFYGQVPLDDNGRPLPYRRTDTGVAILTVIGELVNRGAWVGASSGLVSYEGIKFQMLKAAQDPKCTSILLDLESPGGEAVGAFECSQVAREVAKEKPVTAIINGMACSAAYAIAAGAGNVVTIPTGQTGSIGVVMLHLDFSKFLEEEGVKPTLIFTGAHKVDGNQFEPLPEEVRATFQAECDAFYAQFVATVGAGRAGLAEAAIRATEAQTYTGQDAVDVGLADSVGTFEEVLADLSRGSPGRAPTSTSLKGAKMDPIAGPPAAVTAGQTITTSAQLAAAYPTLAAELRTEGATAERTRILGIDGLGVKGHDALLADLKADGKTTPAEAALAVLNAEKTTRGQQLAAIQGVEQLTGAVAAAPSNGAAAAAAGGPAADTPDGWKAEYAKSADLQGEFGSVDAYVAFKQAEASGRVRILRQKSA